MRRLGAANALMLTAMAAFVLLFAYVSAALPDRGDPSAPATTRLTGEFIERTEHDIEIPNLVSAILADVRGYDTLGETIVIFTAAMAVLLVLMRGYQRES